VDEKFLDLMSNIHDYDYKKVVGGIEVIHSSDVKKVDYNWYRKMGVDAYIVHKENKYPLPNQSKLVARTPAFDIYIDESAYQCYFLQKNLDCLDSAVFDLNKSIKQIRFKNNGPEIDFSGNVDFFGDSPILVPSLQHDPNLELKVIDSAGQYSTYKSILGPMGFASFTIKEKNVRGLEIRYKNKWLDYCVFVSFLFTIIFFVYLLCNYFFYERRKGFEY
jgi:hypothetical protein